MPCLLDHLIGAQQERLRNLDSERIGGPLIECKGEANWSFNGQVAGPGVEAGGLIAYGPSYYVGRAVGLWGDLVRPINFACVTRLGDICLAASLSFHLIAGPFEDELCTAAARKTLLKVARI